MGLFIINYLTHNMSDIFWYEGIFDMCRSHSYNNNWKKSK